MTKHTPYFRGKRTIGVRGEEQNPMFILKKTHDRLMKEKDAEIERLKANRDLSEILRDITGKLNKHADQLFFADGSGRLTRVSFEENLSDSIPRLLDDHFGGKVFKHEARKVVILDKEGNATYSQTKRVNDKGYKYVLVRK